MDYSSRVTAMDVLRFSTERVSSGDILAFHDSYRAELKLRYALPRALALLQERGFSFAPMGMPELRLCESQARSATTSGLLPMRVGGARGCK